MHRLPRDSLFSGGDVGVLATTRGMRSTHGRASPRVMRHSQETQFRPAVHINMGGKSYRIPVVQGQVSSIMRQSIAVGMTKKHCCPIPFLTCHNCSGPGSRIVWSGRRGAHPLRRRYRPRTARALVFSGLLAPPRPSRARHHEGMKRRLAALHRLDGLCSAPVCLLLLRSVPHCPLAPLWRFRGWRDVLRGAGMGVSALWGGAWWCWCCSRCIF